MRNKEELKKFLIWLDGQGLLAFYVDDNNLSNNQLEQIMDDYMKYCTMHPHQKFQPKPTMSKKKIVLGERYTLDMGQQVTLIPRRILKEGIECEYVMSSPGRKELIQYNIWEMNGYNIDLIYKELGFTHLKPVTKPK